MIAPNGTVYVDNTTLRGVASCTMQTGLRAVHGMTISEEAHQLECGIASHEVLADYMKGEPAEKCLAKYELYYRGYSLDYGLDNPDYPLYRLSWTNTDKILREWFERHPRNGLNFSINPALVEVGFQLPLSDECVCGCAEKNHDSDGRCRHHRGGGAGLCVEFRPAFIFWGRLDAIVQASHDNSLYVLDHKTTGRIAPYWTDKFRMDSQMTGYVWAAQKTLGQPVVGVFINSIEYSKLPSDPVRKCKTHGVVYAECGALHMKSELLIYTRTPEQLEQWRQDAVALARKYRDTAAAYPTLESLTNAPMEGTFTGACSFCTFKKFCESGRPLHYADSMLVYKPWRPFTVEEEGK